MSSFEEEGTDVGSWGSNSRRSRSNNKPDTVLGRPPSRSTEDQVLTAVTAWLTGQIQRATKLLMVNHPIDQPNNRELGFTIVRLPRWLRSPARSTGQLVFLNGLGPL